MNVNKKNLAKEIANHWHSSDNEYDNDADKKCTIDNRLRDLSASSTRVRQQWKNIANSWKLDWKWTEKTSVVPGRAWQCTTFCLAVPGNEREKLRECANQIDFRTKCAHWTVEFTTVVVMVVKFTTTLPIYVEDNERKGEKQRRLKAAGHHRCCTALHFQTLIAKQTAATTAAAADDNDDVLCANNHRTACAKECWVQEGTIVRSVTQDPFSLFPSSFCKACTPDNIWQTVNF